jgi:hypothetical protein
VLRSGRQAGPVAFVGNLDLNEFMTMKQSAVIVLACCVSAACYKQVPITTMTPASQTRVQAQLTDSGTVAMGAALGPGVLEVEGVVASATEDAWTLNLIRVDHRGGQSILWNREPVIFPRSVLIEPKSVILDKKKSWLMGGGVVLGAFLLAQSFSLLGSSEEDPDGEVPELIIVPWLPGSRK